MRPGRARLLKLVGAARLAGVAATGLLAARTERRRRAYEPDEIRERLHARYARAQSRRDSGAD